MKILFIGDVVGRSGRKALAKVLPSLVKEKRIDLVIANIENLAGGKGATSATWAEIKTYGVNIGTSGNHIWFREEFFEVLESDETVIRPANYFLEVPGAGHTIYKVANKKVLIINLLGRTWMDEKVNDPFSTVTNILKNQEKENPDFILLDIHAEATSEKGAMGWFLDGKVTAVLGTHTHIPSADEKILPNGTAFVTDLGMTGALNSVLGVSPNLVIEKLRSPLPIRFEWVEEGPSVFRSVLIETEKKLTSKSIKRIDRLLD